MAGTFERSVENSRLACDATRLLATARAAGRLTRRSAGRQRLRHEHRAVEVRVGEAEHEELVRPGRVRHEVVVVGDPERVLDQAVRRRRPGRTPGLRSWTGSGSRRCRSRCSARRRCRGTADLPTACSGRLRAVHAGDVVGAREVDLEDLLDFGLAAVAQALAVALVDQELVVVEGHDLADARAAGELVAVFVRGARRDVDRDDAQQLLAAPPAASWISGACMMPTSVLPSGVIARPSMPLLAMRPLVLPLISVAPTGLRLGHVEIGRQREAAQALAGGAVELVDVGAVFVGDEDALAVIGDADATPGRAGRCRVAGGLRRIEIVRAAGEVELARGVRRRRAGAERLPLTWCRAPRRCRRSAASRSTTAWCRSASASA